MTSPLLRPCIVLSRPSICCSLLSPALSCLRIYGGNASGATFIGLSYRSNASNDCWLLSAVSVRKWKRDASTRACIAQHHDNHTSSISGPVIVERQLELARQQREEARRKNKALQQAKLQESLAELDSEIASQESEAAALASRLVESNGGIVPVEPDLRAPQLCTQTAKESSEEFIRVSNASRQLQVPKLIAEGLSSATRATEGWSYASPSSGSNAEASGGLIGKLPLLAPAAPPGRPAEVTGPLAHAALRPVILRRKKPLPDSWDTPGGTVVLVDKPPGWTSFAVCGRLRSVLRVKKVGHAGTLDPLATGLLVVCVGKATKLADSFQALYKVYSGTMKLGEGTPSLDSDTPVNERMPWEHISDTDLQAVAEAQLGDIMQIPPMYSAIKVKGEKMYDKARRGETVELAARPVKIYELTLERSEQQAVRYRVMCSKGTYVRSLIRDIGRQLGSCAHVTALRREQIGELSVEDAWPAEELLNQLREQKSGPLNEQKSAQGLPG